MKRHSIVLFCLLFLVLGCGDTAPVDSGEVGSESTGALEEGGEAAEGGGEAVTDLCGDKDCADGNPCTDDSCDEVTGDCLNDSVPDRTCDDGNACSTDDVCGDTGVCAGASSLLCDDGEACTNDLCDEMTGCVFEAVADGETCNDGDSCTMVDACKDGVCAGTAKPCPDDDNPCTVASGCDEKTGECLFLNVPDETLCDDGNECTAEDACVEGECLSDKDTLCDDGNECTDDGCTPKSGCTFFPNQEFCDDGTLCTTNDKCLQGQCKGDVLECDDGNQCTNDGCDPEKGCDYVPVTGPCEDGNPCTLNDLCEDSVCASGQQKSCDDGNPCSDEYCALATGDCVYEYIDTPCNDGDICTEGDNCKNGVCKGGTPLNCDDNNDCTSDSCDPEAGCINETISNKPCDDGNACTVGDTCVEGDCDPGNAKECDDDNVCTDDSCDSETGCTYGNNAVSCDDGNACTTADNCSEGGCVGGPSKDCDDSNPCTDDSCDPATGCTYVNNVDPCDDGNACTTADFCGDSTCAGTDTSETDCDDGNVCTTDGCVADTGCVNPANSNLCDDGNACTTADTCADTLCIGGPAPECDDGNECTDDSCDPDTGCTHTANVLACEDGNACTTADACVETVCVGGMPPNCNDDNVCTDDTCEPDTGCVFSPNVAACDDDNACTTGDVCQDSVCTAGVTPLVCDDDNVCTTDSCNPAEGCVYGDNAAPCDDGNVCTTTDTCAGGGCVGGPAPNCDDGNVCTDDLCQEGTGCVSLDNGVNCDDGNACTVGDVCASGACAGLEPLPCDDGNVCTTDGCVADSGCVHPANSSPCDDGNACTTADTCAETLCIGGAPPNCNDGNVCTDDACDGNTGCTHTPNALACDDGNVCTLNDVCADTACAGVEPLVCDDGNVCTDEICEADKGCVFTANSNPCDDGNACTTADVCSESVCLPGLAPLPCDDGELCTNDGCDPVTGCVITPNDLPCDDDNACTLGDTCGGGTCQSGLGSLNCDDGNVCTNDSCSPGDGCLNLNQAVACEDGNPCTEADYCLGGVCTSGNNACGCEVDADCGAQEDGNLCNGTLFCDQSSFPYSCQVAPETVVVCDATGDTACESNQCDGVSGTCVMTPINDQGPCEDGNFCTLTDKCAGGLCVAGPAQNCDDDNVCTNDSCDSSTGACVNVANDVACDDGNACTAGDACLETSCLGAPIPCEDGNACTSTNCDPATGCTYGGLTGPACDDDNACTNADTCLSGTCGGTSVSCDDDNPCTDDSCDTQNGCVNVPNAVVCDDGNACTTADTCAAKICVGGAPLPCDDGNVCTDDSCDPSSGCLNAANTNPCDDNNACTVDDVCQATACQPGPAADCDDDNPCTDDSCDVQNGCVNAANVLACDDGDACTTADTCAAKVCVGGAAPDCDDGNVCTDDACDSSSGCLNAANVLACDDNNACTVGDVCQATVCQPGSDANCDDNDACTADSCDGATGCVNTDISDDCDDGFACTVDSCDAATGCVYTPNDAACASGELCITDTCDVNAGCVSDITPDCCGNGLVECSNVVQTYSLENDFSPTVNPNGNWTFGYKVTSTSSFIPFQDYLTDIYGQQLWYDPELWVDPDNTVVAAPNVLKNTSGSFWSGVGANEVSLHPGLSGEFAVARFSFDTSLTCEVSGSAGAGNLGETEFIISKNETELEYFSSTSSSPTFGFSNQEFEAGDILDFAVGNKDGFTQDSTPVSITISCEENCLNSISGEQCDDGNDVDGDGCSSTCENEDFPIDCVAVLEQDPGSTDGVYTIDPDGVGGNTPFNVYCDMTTDGGGWTYVARGTTAIADEAGGIPQIDPDEPVAWRFSTSVLNQLAGTLDGYQTYITMGQNGDVDESELGRYRIRFEKQAFSFTTPMLSFSAWNGNEWINSVGNAGVTYGPSWPDNSANICCDRDIDGGWNNCSPGADKGSWSQSNQNQHIRCDDANSITQNGLVLFVRRSFCGDGTVNSSEPCDDGNFLNGDGCSSSCQFECDNIVCDDNNPCTTDTCDATTGCVNINNADACDDGDACTTSDTCSAGTCVGGAAPDCDDGNVCTDDFCDSATGCSYSVNSAACSDGNACTTNDTCIAASCAGGAAPNCDDGNVCTTDSCDSVLGCLNAANSESCDDGDACTVGDVCVQTVCTSGSAALECDDNDACTADSCDGATGCVNTDISGDCDDGVSCTVDSCDAATGCVYTANDGACASGELCVKDTCDVNAGCISDITPDCCGNGLIESQENTSCSDQVTGSLVSDFSQTVNPAGPWAYGYRSSLNGGFVPFSTVKSAPPFMRWYEPSLGNFDTPNVSLNVGDEVVYGTAPGEVELHPGGNGEYATVQWTASDSSECTIAGGAKVGDLSDTDLYVRLNNQTLVSFNSTNNSPDFELGPLSLNPGDIVEVLVGANGDYFYDSTPITLDIVCQECVTSVDSEECDDGNGDDGDGCSSTCENEDFPIDCVGVLQQNPSSPDGVYMIDPDGLGGNAPFDVYCDMTTDGGGWTLTAVSSDDGQNTWTWNNRHYWDTDTTVFGSLDALNQDFKSRAHHEVSMSEVLFVHSPSGVWASYAPNVPSNTSFAEEIEAVSGSVCYPTNSGWPLQGGTLPTNPKLCEKSLYLNARDQDQGGCGGDPLPEDSYGPNWSVNNTQGCPFDDPGNFSSLGPNISTPNVEGEGNATYPNPVGFGSSLGLNTGALGSSQNNMRVYVRRDFCGDGTIDPGEPCDDNNLINGDGCSVTCQVECENISCDDGNVCTTDTCGTTTGCVFTPNTLACDDEDACTTSDTCSAGTCTGGAAPDCDDGNVCTDEFCDSATGCSYSVNSAACSDDNACTTNDTCIAASCVGGISPNCDDSNVCTTDSCDSVLGCLNAATTEACDDGDACTVGDVCVQTACTSGSDANCDDNDACTADSCDAATGCVNTDISGDCDDGFTCTVDTCDAVTGCVNTADDGACATGELCVTDTCDLSAGCVSTLDADCCGNGLIDGFENCTYSGCSQQGAYAQFEGEGGCPVAYWDMETLDSITGYIQDHIGDNDLEIFGNPASGVEGVYGKTYSIGNANSYFISENGYASQLSGASSKSISAWVYSGPGAGTGDSCPVAGFGGLTSQQQGSCSGQAFGLNIKIPELAPAFIGCQAGDLESSEAIQENTWNHMVATYDGSTVRLYLNGSKISEEARVLNTSGTFEKITVGIDHWWGGTTHYLTNGRVDEVKIYDYTISDTAVSQLYDLGQQGVFNTSCVGGEQCDDGNDVDGDGCSGICETEALPIDCAELLEQNSASSDGIYLIDPDGAGGADPFEVYCDMTTDGGGWTLISTQKPDGALHQTTSATTVFNTPGINQKYSNAILASLAANGTYEVMAEENSGPDADAGLVMVYKLPSTVALRFDGQDIDVDSFEWFIGNNTFYWVDNNATDDVTTVNESWWWGISVANTNDAFNGLSADKRCIVKSDFSTTGGTNGDYKLDHFGTHSGTTRCTHSSVNIGLSHWVRRAICGNGQQEGDEQCDDNNLVDGDGCSSTCAFENDCFSLEFDGVDDDVVVSNSSDFDLQTTDFTVEIIAQLDPDCGVNETICALVTHTEGGGGLNKWTWEWVPNSYATASGMTFHINGPVYKWMLNYKDVSILDKWSHLAIVRQGGTLKYYQNGELKKTETWNGSIPSINAPLIFGSSEGAHRFEGLMNAVKISKSAMYTADFTPTIDLQVDENTLALWDFSDGSGSVLTDQSGNGHDGTINGATWVNQCPADICGNGVVESWESCDDGNNSDGDGCSATCENEFVIGSASTFDAGHYHTCGIQPDGGVLCWGQNSHSQTDPPEGSFLAITAGSYHNCGLQTDGSVLCWGKNDSGQSIAPTGTFDSISAGDNYTCGLKSDGSAQCWGSQTNAPEGNFIMIRAGGVHTCGLQFDGSVQCWGANEYGQSSPPVESFDEIAVGANHTCGLQSDGSVQCWGWDEYGQSSPPAENFVEITACANNTCGLKSDGSVWCWGWIGDGQSSPPGEIFSAITTGLDHTCGRKSDGSILCWGSDDEGQSSPPSGLNL